MSRDKLQLLFQIAACEGKGIILLGADMDESVRLILLSQNSVLLDDTQSISNHPLSFLTYHVIALPE